MPFAPFFLQICARQFSQSLVKVTKMYNKCDILFNKRDIYFSKRDTANGILFACPLTQQEQK